MLTLIISITFLGFFVLYHTSEKVQLSSSLFLEKWVRDHRLPSKYLGYGLIAIALILSIIFYGVGSGSFAGIVILMTVASTTVLLAPLGFLTFSTLTIIFMISILTEIIFI
ncbi:hypothetical protein RM545_06285 [Zunongwangia sp. F260]|uniref:NADH dehydrogenase subunit 6 n=1 Tax=Autumnicola lenta TaxID=3075593 RepID=A0ABU3CIV3_9FLAO|nr:hypothetical protein [Zunongwangia sp. F260]MDT0646292.1 hypothetical protein [Zunongwangia sp. F260]